MRFLCSTLNGLENLAKAEIYKITKKSPKKVAGGELMFSTKNINDFYRLVYSTRLLLKSVLLLKKFEFKNKKDLIPKISKINFKPYLKENFSISCKRVGKHKFNSADILKEVPKLFKNYKLNFKNPETIIFIKIINKICFIGIDLISLDLNKRFYKIKTHYLDINSCLAFSLVKAANYNPKLSLVDPFCGCGTIVIEAALYACNIPPLYYKKDQLNTPPKIMEQIDKKINWKIKTKIHAFDNLHFNVTNSRINAKVANINDKIDFKNYSLGWLDTKLKKGSIDLIITQPPIVSRKHNEEEITKIYDKLFNQSKYILSKKGKIILITQKPELLLKKAKEYKFKISKEINIKIGDTKYRIIVLK